MSLRAPLGRVLGLGTAKDGTGHFWAQRVSALALLLLGLWFVAAQATQDNFAYAEVKAAVELPFNSMLLALLCVSAAYHSYLGVQVIVEDYVHAAGLKMTCIILSRFAHVFVAVVLIYAILRIGLGA